MSMTPLSELNLPSYPPQGSSTWNAEPTGSNGHMGPASDKQFDVPALPTEPPRRVRSLNYAVASSWEVQAQTVYSANM
jgi:hypothetical protein